jgi:hypothetical protein
MNDLSNADTVPLSFAQRARLAVECLPALFFSLALVLVVTLLDDITGAPPPIPLVVFLCVVIVVTGWAAINRLLDLVSGAALAREDLLVRSWRSRRASTNPFHARFEQLGTMRLSRKAYGQGQNGARYCVCYSPASKIVWWLEKPR